MKMRRTIIYKESDDAEVVGAALPPNLESDDDEQRTENWGSSYNRKRHAKNLG